MGAHANAPEVRSNSHHATSFCHPFYLTVQQLSPHPSPRRVVLRCSSNPSTPSYWTLPPLIMMGAVQRVDI
eukprot:2887541-Amphidinium_carterae.1